MNFGKKKLCLLKYLTMKNFLVISLLLFTTVGFSQNADTLSAVKKSAKLIKLGIELYDNDDYTGALNIFDSISDCDPNYSWAIYEKALCYWQLNNLDSAMFYSLEALSLSPDDVDITIGTGSILNDAGRTTEAINLLESSLKKWPYSAGLLYNLGLCYVRSGRMQEAENTFLKGIILRPFHANSHLALARANFKMGRLARSYLAYNMAVLMKPTIKSLSEFESCIDGSRDTLNLEYLYQYPSNTNNLRKWEELDYLMKTGLAFNENYSYDGDFDYLTARQSHLLFNQMIYDRTDTCLFNQFYIRFFKELFNTGKYNTFLYYSLNELSSEKVSSWISKNRNELDAFISWAQTYFNEKRSYKYCPRNEASGYRMLHFDEDDTFLGEGIMEEKKNLVKNGKWVHTASSGRITEKGEYLNDLATGEWLIYGQNGSPNQKLQFKDGELDGECFSYDPKGNITGIHPRKNDEIHGFERYLTSSGKLISEYKSVDGKIEGLFTEYNYPGFFVKTTNFKNNKAEGSFEEKWLSGQIKTEGFYKDSLIEGPVTTWYPNSAKETTATYSNGILTGKHTSYYPSGNISEVQTYDEEGLLTGIKYYFNPVGNISQKDSLYSKGILNGLKFIYFDNGQVSSIQEVRNDTIIGVKSFDGKGNLIYKAEIDNDKSLSFKLHFIDGLVEREGNLKNGLFDGELKYYYPNGNLKSVLNFEEGEQNGKQTLYHPNGELKEVFFCKDGYYHGSDVIYYSNGVIQKKGNFFNGEHDGEITNYHPNGNLQSRVFVVEGKQAGRSIQYNSKGNVKEVEYFDNEGKSYRKIFYNHSGDVSLDIKYEYDTIQYTELYPSGVAKHKGAYVDNNRHGTFEWYYPNGQLERSEQYLYGFLVESIKSFDFTGMLIAELPYVMNNIDGQIKWYNDGKITAIDPYVMNSNQGMYIDYYRNGRVKRKIHFLDDSREGEAFYYSPDSMLMFKILNNQDIIKEITYMNAQGNYVKPIVIRKGSQDVVTYYSNGKVSAKFTLLDGLYSGRFYSYYPTGKPFSETDFVKGDINGISKFYFSNGNLKELIEMKNDKQDGSYVLYHENGQKAKEGRYIMNYEDGEWRIFNESGKLTYKLYYDCGELYEIVKM